MKNCFLIAWVLAISITGSGQSPIRWDFSAKKIGDGKYELHMKASILEPWHTYSQFTPDGGPLPTKITFIRNPLVKIEGKVKEWGILKSVHDNTFDVEVKYFTGDVDFVQVVSVQQGTKTKLTGTVEYMACTDKECLPPKSVPFTISLQ